MGEQQPLPEDWDNRDSHDSFFEYIAICREEQAAGKPPAPMFVPSRDWGGGIEQRMPNDTLPSRHDR